MEIAKWIDKWTHIELPYLETLRVWDSHYSEPVMTASELVTHSGYNLTSPSIYNINTPVSQDF
jgi:hypothetical protein